MENIENFYRNKRILITGATGLKGLLTMILKIYGKNLGWLNQIKSPYIN